MPNATARAPARSADAGWPVKALLLAFVIQE